MDLNGVTRQYIDDKLQQILQERHPSLLNLEGKVRRMEKLCNNLLTTKTRLNEIEDNYKKGSEKVHTRMHWVNTKMEEYEKKFTLP